jgi:hypothetical protein
MTLRKPDDVSVVRWLLGDIKPAHLLMAAATCLGSYYGVQTQMAVMQQKQLEQGRQIEALNAGLALKLDKEVYETQQQATNIQLKGISDTVDRIEQFLMDHPRK